MSAMYVVNPGRKRRRHAKRRRRARAHNPAPKRRRSSRRRSNPGRAFNFGGLNLADVGLGVAGAIGAELGGPALTNLLPEQVRGNRFAPLLVKAGVVFLGAMLLRRFVGSGPARAVAIGGGIAVGMSAVREFVPNLLSDYSVMSDYTAFAAPGGTALNGPITDANAMFAPSWGGSGSSR